MKFTIRTKNCRETKTPITGTGPSLKEITQTSQVSNVRLSTILRYLSSIWIEKREEEE